VGIVVGMTGMGGGALMTPILVILFGVSPSTAVSSDLVAAVIMKPFGGYVHGRRGTVHWELVKWLVIGSVPCAFAGVFAMRLFGTGQALQDNLKIFLGITLILAAGAMLAKGWLSARRLATGAQIHGPLKVKRVPTVLIGALGGLLVGMTSVGSGSVIIVSLMLVYPQLSASELVGTDLVQAVPLVASAALAHMLFGDFVLGLTASVVIGSIPGVIIGARISARAPDALLKPVLFGVLLLSGLKLVNVGTDNLGISLVIVALVALPVWGAIDALGRPHEEWTAAGVKKRPWVAVQLLGAFFVIGFAAAVAYFVSVRPKLQYVAAETVLVE
jgi:uncharacterized membrane protein YfcA